MWVLAGIGLLAFVTVRPAVADKLNWKTDLDLPKALAQAKAEHKLVLLDFTGSDWCPPCQLLEAKTFAKPAFAEYAQTNLVLVKVDFPNYNTQPEALKTANDALAKKLEVEGFPTLVALKPDDSVAWRTVGYLEGGPTALIQQLQGVQKL
jgi:protein disulfide-isomerase